MDQALADLAHFITSIKEETPELRNSGVVMMGGSYSASVATWFRLKYPDLVNGVWASSAVLLAKADFLEYREVISESIRLVGGEACHKIFEEAYVELERLIAEGTPERINSEFNLCSPLNTKNEMDVWFFFKQLFVALANLQR